MVQVVPGGQIADGTLVVHRDAVLGEGATARVYKGSLRRGGAVGDVAVKVALSACADGHDSQLDEKRRSQIAQDILHEAEIGARLPAHASLPAFVGWCASEAGPPLVAWELVLGDDLEALFRASRLKAGAAAWQPKEKHVLSWSRQLYAALACLHASRLIHRDVKPANVLISRDQACLKLVDFGLCRCATRGGSSARRRAVLSRLSARQLCSFSLTPLRVRCGLGPAGSGWSRTTAGK